MADSGSNIHIPGPSWPGCLETRPQVVGGCWYIAHLTPKSNPPPPPELRSSVFFDVIFGSAVSGAQSVQLQELRGGAHHHDRRLALPLGPRLRLGLPEAGTLGRGKWRTLVVSLTCLCNSALKYLGMSSSSSSSSSSFVFGAKDHHPPAT